MLFRAFEICPWHFNHAAALQIFLDVASPSVKVEGSVFCKEKNKLKSRKSIDVFILCCRKHMSGGVIV